MLEGSTIIIATDLGQVSAPALDGAVAIARRFAAKRLVIVHAVKVSGPLAGLREVVQRAVARAQSAMDALKVDGGRVVQVVRMVRVGSPSKVVVEVADEVAADLIVMASHGYGSFQRALIGSVTSETIRAAHCPVLVVGPGRTGEGHLRAVTAAVDLSPVSGRVIRSAATFASAYGALLRVVTVADTPGSLLGEAEALSGVAPDELERVREEQMTALQALVSTEAPKATLTTELLQGAPPSQVILRSCMESMTSLVVVGTSGHGAWHRLVLGSTADHVLSEAPCPVLVVPIESFAIDEPRPS